MRLFLILLFVTLGLSTPLQAQGNDIEATIGAQIEALQADDFADAFTYASPTIQGIFGTPENFGIMVQRGFPMVLRPEQLKFLELRDVEGRMFQKVMITDAQGRVHLLDYQMIDLESGWKINGVQIITAPGVSA